MTSRRLPDGPRGGHPVAVTAGARSQAQLEKALGLSRPTDARERGGLSGLVARLGGRRS